MGSSLELVVSRQDSNLPMPYSRALHSSRVANCSKWMSDMMKRTGVHNPQIAEVRRGGGETEEGIETVELRLVSHSDFIARAHLAS